MSSKRARDLVNDDDMWIDITKLKQLKKNTEEEWIEDAWKPLGWKKQPRKENRESYLKISTNLYDVPETDVKTTELKKAQVPLDCKRVKGKVYFLTNVNENLEWIPLEDLSVDLLKKFKEENFLKWQECVKSHDTYDAESKKRNCDKRRVNEWFIQSMIDAWKATDLYPETVLILDSPSLYTTEKIVENFPGITEIFIPNKAVSVEIAHQIESLYLEDIVVTFASSLGDFLRNYWSLEDRKTIDAAWFDYSGTFSRHEEDVKFFFENRMLTQGGVWGITMFRGRGAEPLKVSTIKEKIEEYMIQAGYQPLNVCTVMEKIPLDIEECPKTLLTCNKLNTYVYKSGGTTMVTLMYRDDSVKAQERSLKERWMEGYQHMCKRNLNFIDTERWIASLIKREKKDVMIHPTHFGWVSTSEPLYKLKKSEGVNTDVWAILSRDLYKMISEAKENKKRHVVFVVMVNDDYPRSVAVDLDLKYREATVYDPSGISLNTWLHSVLKSHSFDVQMSNIVLTSYSNACTAAVLQLVDWLFCNPV